MITLNYLYALPILFGSVNVALINNLENWNGSFHTWLLVIASLVIAKVVVDEFNTEETTKQKKTRKIVSAFLLLPALLSVIM